MKTIRKVQVRLKCGEKTCAWSPGKFCRFFGSRNFGQNPICCLFPSDPGTYTDLNEIDGWIQRCEICLSAEK